MNSIYSGLNTYGELWEDPDDGHGGKLEDIEGGQDYDIEEIENVSIREEGSVTSCDDALDFASEDERLRHGDLFLLSFANN